jgi:uncharacterized protein YlxP (DUF503 family)
MVIGVLTLHLLLPGCQSLKDKRGRIKPVLARLHREFNISVAEIDRLDMWQETVLACSLVSNDHAYTQQALQTIPLFIESHWPDFQIIDHRIELI